MTATMVAPQFWIAILRVVVGIWFLKAVWTKLTIAMAFGIVPYPAVSSRFLAFQPKRVAEFAAGNPVAWYKEFLENTVVTHGKVWAMLQAYGEAAVGIGLVLGLLTGLCAPVGLFLALNYGLATPWMSFRPQRFNLPPPTSLVTSLPHPPGRRV